MLFQLPAGQAMQVELVEAPTVSDQVPAGQATHASSQNSQSPESSPHEELL